VSLNDFSPLDVPDGSRPEYVPLDQQPIDWDKAETMIAAMAEQMEGIDTNMGAFTNPQVQPWDEALAVYLDDGTKLFAIYADGSVYANTDRGPDVLCEAAAIFFHNVVEIAKLQGFKIRPEPESAEGWDA
jgi:hypothetical protein